MKTYTGFEALERMKTHWITLQGGCDSFCHILEKGMLVSKFKDGGIKQKSSCMINFFFENEFVDYKPLQVGDWVHVTDDEVEQYVAKVLVIKNGFAEVDETIYVNNAHRFVRLAKLRKAMPEEIVQEKRRRVFAQHGRELDEFKEGDCVTIDAEEDYMKVLCSEGGEVRCIFFSQSELIEGEWFKASELTPVFFVENRVKEVD